MFTRDATRQPRILAPVISYSIPAIIINLVKEHRSRVKRATPRDNTRDSDVVKQSSRSLPSIFLSFVEPFRNSRLLKRSLKIYLLPRVFFFFFEIRYIFLKR